jgi:transposase
LQLVWEEYRQANPKGYRYSWFCERYQHWRRHLDVVLRQEHKAGEKMFVDWAGPTIPVYDSTTGQAWPASLFVAVLGASSYTYVEATHDQQLVAWIQAHIHALEFLGGAPTLTVPDNTKTAVTRACRYDPDLNPTYQEFAVHYGMGVVPARPYKPRDKAKVESGVQVAERWIIAALRNRKFFSLPELNEAIRELLVRLNERPFRKRDGSRASGCVPPLTSTITSPSTATSTVRRTPWCSKSWKFVPPRTSWRSFIRAIESLPTYAIANAGKTLPRTSIAPRVIRHIWNGRLRAW